ncbi:MAG TPA: ABC transporter permease subunit [Trebonia sp.]|nr:ABC transporter permease subunit [Trebonia sp.]
MTTEVSPRSRAASARQERTARRARPGRARGSGRTGPSWRVRLRRDKTLILMTLPALLLLGVFGYVPMLGLVMAFQQYNVYNGLVYSPWVGFANFSQLFGDPLFWHAFWNTLLLFSVQLLLFFPVPIALAILLDGLLSRRVKAFVQSVTALPHFFSWVLVVTIFQQMIGGAGVIPQWLRQHGVANPVDLMTNAGTFKFLVSAQLIWKEAGWNTIVFIAALAAISPSLYEAAAVDGANWRRRTWHITLPGLKGITVLLLILNLGYALTFGFEQMLIQRGAVGPNSAEVLTTFSYIYGIVNGNYSYGAAAGLFLGITSLVLILAANRVAHAFGEDGLYR